MTKKLALGFIILISAVVAYNLITQIISAVKSGERLSQAADAVYQLEAKNKELKRKLSQIRSPEFIEEEVRNKLGFSKKGETVIIIPEEKLKAVMGASQSAVVRLPNWLGWLRIFLK